MPTLLLLVIAILVPAAAQAQPQESVVFVPSESGLKTGREVYVVVDAPCTRPGCPGEWVRGRVTGLTTTSLVVDNSGGRYVFPAAGIQLVKQRGDLVWDGLGWGAVGGALGGFVTGNLLFVDKEWVQACAVMSASIGAGIGVLIDALVTGERTVWDRHRHRSARIGFAPLAGHRAAGFQFNVRF